MLRNNGTATSNDYGIRSIVLHLHKHQQKTPFHFSLQTGTSLQIYKDIFQTLLHKNIRLTICSSLPTFSLSHGHVALGLHAPRHGDKTTFGADLWRCKESDPRTGVQNTIVRMHIMLTLHNSVVWPHSGVTRSVCDMLLLSRVTERNCRITDVSVTVLLVSQNQFCIFATWHRSLPNLPSSLKISCTWHVQSEVLMPHMTCLPPRCCPWPST